MKHKQTRKHPTKNFKHLAAALLGAVIMSASMLPGAAAVAHASADPTNDKPPVTNEQQAPVKHKKTVANYKHHKHKKHDSDKNDSSNYTSSKNAPSNYSEVLDIKATAYAPGAHDNDQWGDKTFTGTNVRPGIIAVDPSVIPLGSKVYIQYPDGHGEYATAEDTGGAIKGNRIDIAKWSVSEAQDFGIQHVKVYIVDKSENA